MKKIVILISILYSTVLAYAQDSCNNRTTLGECITLCADSIDSVIVVNIPKSIFFATNITRESFIENAEQVKTIYAKKDINLLISLLLSCSIQMQMAYDSNQVLKTARVVNRKGHLLLAWFNQEKSDLRSLIILCNKNKHKLVWIDPWRSVFIDNYCCEITKEINDYITYLFEE